MRCLISPTHDPHENLALEEHLLRAHADDFFLLWRARPSVVVGKHQNAFSEVNLREARALGLEVARRISGGGTVYHDLGNLNFAFVVNAEAGRMVDFRKHLAPVAQVLEQDLGLRVAIGPRNDLRLDGLKISGNAEHVFKQRVLHHGTLLFSADLDLLERAIRPGQAQFEDKAVRSVRSQVANIAPRLGPRHAGLDADGFARLLLEGVASRLPGAQPWSPSAEHWLDVGRRRAEKFATWDWVWGYSPRYRFVREAELLGKPFRAELQVAKGRVEAAALWYDGHALPPALGESLRGLRHLPEELLSALRGHALPAAPAELLELLF